MYVVLSGLLVWSRYKTDFMASGGLPQTPSVEDLLSEIGKMKTRSQTKYLSKEENDGHWCFPGCTFADSVKLVECSNKQCLVGWFHIECVGLDPENPPPGIWLCPVCRVKVSDTDSALGLDSDKLDGKALVDSDQVDEKLDSAGAGVDIVTDDKSKEDGANAVAAMTGDQADVGQEPLAPVKSRVL